MKCNSDEILTLLSSLGVKLWNIGFLFFLFFFLLAIKQLCNIPSHYKEIRKGCGRLNGLS